MCNACGNYCCGSDMFGGCGCDGCDCEECWSDVDDFFCDEIEDGFDAGEWNNEPERPKGQAPEPFASILADALKANGH